MVEISLLKKNIVVVNALNYKILENSRHVSQFGVYNKRFPCYKLSNILLKIPIGFLFSKSCSYREEYPKLPRTSFFCFDYDVELMLKTCSTKGILFEKPPFILFFLIMNLRRNSVLFTSKFITFVKGPVLFFFSLLYNII